MLLPYRWPRPIRLAAYALATMILLYMCFAPSNDLPKVNIWDKEEHAIAWFVLAATGLMLSPRLASMLTRPIRIAGKTGSAL